MLALGQNFDINMDGWDFYINGKGCMKSLNNNIWKITSYSTENALHLHYRDNLGMQLMVFGNIIALYSEYHTGHINTLYEKNPELLLLKYMVHIATNHCILTVPISWNVPEFWSDTNLSKFKINSIF